MSRLDEIAARADAATPGPWKSDTEVRGDCVVWGPNGRFLMNAQAEPHWLAYPGENRMVSFDVDRRDAEFIANARADVPLLLALVRSQAAQLDAMAKLADTLAIDSFHETACFPESSDAKSEACDAIRAALGVAK